MNDSDTTEIGTNPNDVLSKRVVAALAGKNLIVETRASAAAQKISTGTAAVSDWGVWAREAIKLKDSSDAKNTAD